MTARAKTIMMALVALVTGLVAGGAAGGYLGIRFVSLFFADGQMLGQAVVTQQRTMVLEHLRKGETDKAIELLESQLDSDIIGLRVIEDYSETTNDGVRRTISRAKEYRAAFPRTTKYPEVDAGVRNALNSVPPRDSRKQ